MLLGFKMSFPDGTDTLFREKIIASVVDMGFIKEEKKIHSIHEGERWKAGMSIQMAYGVRTKHYSQFNKGIKALGYCVSVQKIEMDFHFQTDCLQVYVDGRKLSSKQIIALIKNDGLTRDRFIKWFFSNSTSFSGQIIHWTDFKY